MRPSRISTKVYALVDVDVVFNADRFGEIAVHSVTLDMKQGQDISDLITDGDWDNMLDKCEEASYDEWA